MTTKQTMNFVKLNNKGVETIINLDKIIKTHYAPKTHYSECQMIIITAELQFALEGSEATEFNAYLGRYCKSVVDI